MLIEALFPNVVQADYRITSPASLVYNCIAWAAGDDGQWWEPISGPGYYWPGGVPFTYSIDDLVKVYESLGYARCESSAFEAGYEKVALYGIAPEYTHAARQLSDGKWTSKLGHLEDIEHSSLDALEGVEYGLAGLILKRPTQQKSTSP